jgi:hypothetical protein
MEYTAETHRLVRPLAFVAALFVIVVVLRAPSSPVITAPPDAVQPFGASIPLQAEFEARPAPQQIALESPLDGHESVVSLGLLNLYTTNGSYTVEQVRGLAQPIHDALTYVQTRTDMQLSEPVTIIFDRRDSCGLDGAAFTQKRTIILYACTSTPTNRAINILAHEFVHQLAHDRYGPAHLQADLILSEGLATWGAGKYWLGDEASFRSFVHKHYAAQLLPLGSHYRDYGTIDAMNRLYYQWASLVDFLIETRGRESFDALYASGRGMNPNTADYVTVLGSDLAGVEEQWRAWLTR